MTQISIEYSIHPQQRSFAGFQSDKKGLQQALRFVKKMVKLGYTCTPNEKELLKLLNKI